MARERIEVLLDEGSFEERRSWNMTAMNLLDGRAKGAGDGVMAIGHGTIDGKEVFVFSQDFTVFGGSISAAHARSKIAKVMEQAAKVGAPVIGRTISGGASNPGEGVASLAGYADVFQLNAAIASCPRFH